MMQGLRNRPRADAALVYLVNAGATSFFFALIFTVNLVYHAQTVGLNPLQLVLVGTVLEISALLFEIPTGVVADVISRRLSVLIGTFITGAAFIIEGAFPSFATVLLAQVIWGLGATFISGANDAWIADEVGVAQAEALYIRAAQVGNFTSLIGVGVSVLLATIALQVPIVLGGLLFIGLAFWLALAMPEQGFQPCPTEERMNWRSFTGTFCDGVKLVRLRPVLLTILLVSAVYGLFTEGVDRLWTPYLLEIGLPPLGSLDPVLWWGLLSAGRSLLAIAATEWLARVQRRDSERPLALLLPISALMILATLAFAIAPTFALAVVAFWVLDVLRTLLWPIYTAWLNRHSESEVRATLLSMASQTNALGQIAVAPLVGYLGLVASLRVALLAAGLALLPMLPLMRRGMRQSTPLAGAD